MTVEPEQNGSVSASPSAALHGASTDAEPSAAMGVEYPAAAERSYAPGLERWAENQRPKTSDHQDARLYRYVGTDLYQWFSKRNGSVFYDACDEPFLIARSKPAIPIGVTIQALEGDLPELPSDRRADALSVGLDAEPSAQWKLDRLMGYLASAWFHGGWKAETHTERHMQAMLEDAGWWPVMNERDLMDRLDARVPS